MSTPDAQPCKHPTIQTFRFADTGEPAGLWACADCRRKFAPLDVESAAEIERLRDELNLCCALKREYQQQAAGGIERLCEEIERLRADAARYRWLRATTNWVSSKGERINVRDNPELWDSAIDAAMRDAP